MKDLLLCVHVVVETFIWKTALENCTKVRAARAARLFILIQPIRSLSSGVVVAKALKPRTYFSVVQFSCIVFNNDSVNIPDTHSCFKIRLLKENVALFYGLLWVFLVRPVRDIKWQKYQGAQCSCQSKIPRFLFP